MWDAKRVEWMAHELIIRIADVADAALLAQMHVASWRETYAGILPDSMLAALSVEHRAAMWEQIMRQPATQESTIVHLARADGEIVGFGSCGSQRTESLKAKGFDGEVSAIYVRRPSQRSGVGLRLLRSMASDLVNRNFAAASLWVLRENFAARRFYERHGSQLIDEREEAHDDALLVELAYGWVDLGGYFERNRTFP